MTEQDSLFSILTSSLGVAIVTAIITAFATYKISHSVENRKEFKKGIEQRQFSFRVEKAILSEIIEHRKILGILENGSKSPPENAPVFQIDPKYLEIIVLDMKVLRNSYSGLPIEIKVKLFSSEVYGELEQGYRYYNQLTSDLQYKIDKGMVNADNYIEYFKTPLEECRKNLDSAATFLVEHPP